MIKNIKFYVAVHCHKEYKKEILSSVGKCWFAFRLYMELLFVHQ